MTRPVTYSRPVKMAFRSTDDKQKFYRVVGRAGVRRVRVHRINWWGIAGVMIATALSVLLWLAMGYLVVKYF